jgi:hypothetical protein
MNKKTNIPSKEKEKLVLNLFKYDVAKKIGLTRDCLFILRELLRWWSAASYNVEDRAFETKGYKLYYLSLKIKCQEWFFNERTLSECIKKLESCGMIARVLYQFQRGDDKRKTKKYLGKKLYLVPIARALKQLCEVEHSGNEKIKDFIDSIEKLNPDYKYLERYQKRIKEKELINIEKIKNNKNERISVMTNDAIEKSQKMIRTKMNKKDEEFTENELDEIKRDSDTTWAIYKRPSDYSEAELHEMEEEENYGS